MLALVLQEIGTLAIETIDDPVARRDEVLIRIAATGICGSDVHGYAGETGRRFPGQVMGHETVGWVEEVGSGAVSAFRRGELVTFNPVIGCGTCTECQTEEWQRCYSSRVIGVDPTCVSAFAELIAVPTRNVVSLEGLEPLELGALVEPLSVGYHAARRGACSQDDTVLVIGGGPIGQACVLAARRLGAEAVYVSEPVAQRRATALALGAQPVTPDELAALARNEPSPITPRPTLVFDAVGSQASIESALSASALGARIVLVGMASPTLTLGAFDISTGDRSVIGSFCYSGSEFRGTAEWVRSGPRELNYLIDRRIGLPEAPAVFAELAAGRAEYSKAVISIGTPLLDAS